jgi:hypothetical protein
VAPQTHVQPVESFDVAAEAAGGPWNSAIRCSQSLVTPNSRICALLATGLEQLRAWHRHKSSVPAATAPAGSLPKN